VTPAHRARGARRCGGAARLAGGGSCLEEEEVDADGGGLAVLVDVRGLLDAHGLARGEVR
jgi:hypothetical protein